MSGGDAGARDGTLMILVYWEKEVIEWFTLEDSGCEG
jgi:hypothetical protein